MLQNKETTAQSYLKISNQNTKKSPGVEGALFNCTVVMWMDSFGCLNSFELFLFYKEPVKKKNMAYVRLQLNLRPPPIRASIFLAVPPLSSERTYFMDEPYLI